MMETITKEGTNFIIKETIPEQTKERKATRETLKAELENLKNNKQILQGYLDTINKRIQRIKTALRLH